MQLLPIPWGTVTVAYISFLFRCYSHPDMLAACIAAGQPVLAGIVSATAALNSSSPAVR
jgi:hypothetical protein